MVLTPVGDIEFVTVSVFIAVGVGPKELDGVTVRVPVGQAVPDPVPVWLAETDDETDPDPDVVLL